ncbi:hypothetical protein CBOM_05629 [Ceraceosorus bombacis]|uniref:Uncharacterized protein n=1 Tax=Ceraceosorus bombacis TaxID=401625 RepID=A0A0N7LBB6_9BASI|nr:hypothetical protein CBOM_05629 [Ceraceosorus bombacis]
MRSRRTADRRLFGDAPRTLLRGEREGSSFTVALARFDSRPQPIFAARNTQDSATCAVSIGAGTDVLPGAAHLSGERLHPAV